MRITFAVLADLLKHGREIECRYTGRDYSITNSRHQWRFCCDIEGTTVTLCAFSEFETLVEKTGSLEIGGVSVEDIFNKQLGNLEVLGIL